MFIARLILDPAAAAVAGDDGAGAPSTCALAINVQRPQSARNEEREGCTLINRVVCVRTYTLSPQAHFVGTNRLVVHTLQFRLKGVDY